MRDERGISKPLGPLLARGGEGGVYRLAERDDVLVKVYHPEVLADAARRRRLERKIGEMCQAQELRNHSRAAWPRTGLLSSAGEWCGYAMLRKHGVSLRELCGNPVNLARLAPAWHRQHLVKLCVDFLDTIDAFCSKRTLPIDFNPSNFLVNVSAVEVNFIDCDGFQFLGASVMHLCEAVLPEMCAPEILARKNWREVPVAASSLRFSIGMMLFYILMVGNSPYRHRNGNDPVENLANGCCGLGIGADCQLPSGLYYTIWSHLIFDLKALFIRCFRDGHGKPDARPSVAEWRSVLVKYNACLRAGHAEASIIPDRPKSAEFRGPV